MVTCCTAQMVKKLSGLATGHIGLCRPINRTLVAQRITRPQLCVAALCTGLHWPLTYLLMVSSGRGCCSTACVDDQPGTGRRQAVSCQVVTFWW